MSRVQIVATWTSARTCVRREPCIESTLCLATALARHRVGRVRGAPLDDASPLALHDLGDHPARPAPGMRSLRPRAALATSRCSSPPLMCGWLGRDHRHRDGPHVRLSRSALALTSPRAQLWGRLESARSRPLPVPRAHADRDREAAHDDEGGERPHGGAAVVAVGYLEHLRSPEAPAVSRRHE